MPNDNAIQKAAAGKAAVSVIAEPKTMQTYIKQMEGEIAKALPSVLTPERFSRIVLSALSTNRKLAETTPQSFLGAMMTAAQLGVEPNTPLGQAYLIPYYNNREKRLECQFQLGYRGLIDLAFRSSEVKSIQAQTVYANDVFAYSFGLEPELKHTPASGDRGDPIFFYAIFHTKDGGYGFEVMGIDDIRVHAKRYSKAYESGPWQTNFEEMAKKTVLKRVLKYAPLKTDFVRGLAADETVKTEISEDMYAVPSVYAEDDASVIVDVEYQPATTDTNDA
jgi:recombination protein RecT